MKHQATILLAILFGLSLPSQAGFFLDDPIEVDAECVPHLLSHDEIVFKPTGKCKYFVMAQCELTLDLTYMTGKKRLFASQKLWSHITPIRFQLPDDLSGLQSYRLTGKYDPPPMIPTLKNTGDFNRDWKTIKGYKDTIDLAWTVK